MEGKCGPKIEGMGIECQTIWSVSTVQVHWITANSLLHIIRTGVKEMSSLPRLLHVCAKFLCICVTIYGMSNSEYFQGLHFTILDYWLEEAHIICRFTWRKIFFYRLIEYCI